MNCYHNSIFMLLNPQELARFERTPNHSNQKNWLYKLEYTGYIYIQGRPQGGGGSFPPPARNRKNCCRKRVLFSRAVLNDKAPGRWDRKWIKSQFSIEIFICNFQDFLNKFQFPLVFSPNAQKFAARFLKFF